MNASAYQCDISAPQEHACRTIQTCYDPRTLASLARRPPGKLEVSMSDESLRSAGILLVILPTVAFGGVSILYLWITSRSDYMQNRLRARLWAAGHAHAGVFLILSLVALQYID
jgi:hypothetical protein